MKYLAIGVCGLGFTLAFPDGYTGQFVFCSICTTIAIAVA